MNSHFQPRPIMIMGTSSGSGKSLMTTAICRWLQKKGEVPIPFKGQNMSNNAWVDINGGEMAYSQAVQAWAANLEPISAMNPILLKPKGDSISEVIHLGQTQGSTSAHKYYEDWFNSGWLAILQGLKMLKENHINGRLVIEGAGSPVEVNLQHRDLTNLKLAKHVNANCLLVADIERGGVFAQIIGTLSLLKPDEKSLFNGIIINRFRGDLSLFESGRKWIEEETGIPVLGIMPWLNELFPPEDSLDLLERKKVNKRSLINIAVIKLPSVSNFSDFDPLDYEDSVQVKWIDHDNYIEDVDAIIIPGSKQTIKDIKYLYKTGLAEKIKHFARNGGHVLGICGGMQIMGLNLIDPIGLESNREEIIGEKLKGLGLLPINTIFDSKKSLKRRKEIILWPDEEEVEGFELHHGISEIENSKQENIDFLFRNKSLGYIKKDNQDCLYIGTYLHGLFENGCWRRKWINILRKKKGLLALPTNEKDHKESRDKIFDNLANCFNDHIDIERILRL